MDRKVLVLGGSYFVGRVFCILASQQDDLELFVVNRGRYTLDKPHITEFKCERHEIDKLVGLLPPVDFDAVVDFCAYEPGDIDLIVGALGDRIGQYIYISTASVYAPQEKLAKAEDSPLIESFDGGPEYEYIRKKALLEQELVKVAGKRGTATTIIRPSFIFGPYNYAPRESYFIEKIVKGQAVPVPIDATAKFSFAYVTDVGRALIACAGDSRSFGKIFNFAAPEAIDYATLIAELERCNKASFTTEPVTVTQVLRENIPLPFPLDADDLTDGRLFSKTFDFAYSPFPEAMLKTFAAFKNVYS